MALQCLTTIVPNEYQPSTSELQLHSKFQHLQRALLAAMAA